MRLSDLLLVPMLGLLAVPALTAARAGAGQQPVFRAGVDLVNFGVTAVDRKGELITDLKREDFEIVRGRPPADRPVLHARPGGG